MSIFHDFFSAIYCFCFRPRPVHLEEVHALIKCIERVDGDIRFLQREQVNTADVYHFALIEHQIQDLLHKRVALSREKQALLARAKKQGPGIDCSLYSRLD